MNIKDCINRGLTVILFLIVFSLVGIIPNPLLNRSTTGIIVDQIIIEYPAEGKARSFVYAYCIDNQFYLNRNKYKKGCKIGDVYEIKYSSIFKSMSKIIFKNVVNKEKIINIDCLNYCFEQYKMNGDEISKWK